MRLRALKQKDILSCSKIIEKNYSKKYRDNSILEMKEMFGNSKIKPKYIVAEENNKIRGFGGYIQSWIDYGIYQIFWINVDPEFQRKNIGTKIVNEIIKEIKSLEGWAKKASLVELSTSKPEFYEKKFGFKKVYNKKDNEYLMVLKI